MADDETTPKTRRKQAEPDQEPDPNAVFDPPVPPPLPLPDKGDVQTVTAIADDAGADAVIVVGPKDGNGAYPYVRVQPFDVKVGDDVQTLEPSDRKDTGDIWILSPRYGWLLAPIDTYPRVTQPERPAPTPAPASP